LPDDVKIVANCIYMADRVDILVLNGLEIDPNDHEDAFITPENERYCAGGSGTRSIKFLEI
jgi:hypothetical protein